VEKLKKMIENDLKLLKMLSEYRSKTVFDVGIQCNRTTVFFEKPQVRD